MGGKGSGWFRTNPDNPHDWKPRGSGRRKPDKRNDPPCSIHNVPKTRAKDDHVYCRKCQTEAMRQWRSRNPLHKKGRNT